MKFRNLAFIQVFIFFLFLGNVFGQQNEKLTLKAMTFNIRLHIASDGTNNWENRRDWVGQLIHFYDPDVVGCQEVVYDQLTDMLARMPAYSYAGVGRDDGKKAGEFSPVFYKTAKYHLLDQATFWLSENPGIPGKGWDAAYNRVVTWVKLQDKVSGRIFFVFNTHFDNEGEKARRESALLLLRKIRQIAGREDAVITGDFNATEQSDVYRELTHSTDSLNVVFDTYHMARFIYGPAWTFHGFGSVPVDQREKIDYLFVNRSDHVTVPETVIISEQRGDLFPSDHCPLMAVIVFEYSPADRSSEE